MTATGRHPELPWVDVLLPCLGASLLGDASAAVGRAEESLEALAAEVSDASASRTLLLRPASDLAGTVRVPLGEGAVLVERLGDTEPPLFAVYGLATEAQLASLAELAAGQSERAAVEDGRVDPELRSGRVRSLQGSTDAVVKAVLGRAVAAARAVLGPGGLSPLPDEVCCGSATEASLVQYGIGDHYDWHADRAEAARRLTTTLLYLTDAEAGEGGLTEFRFLRLAVRPRAGAALLWANPPPPAVQRMLHRSTAVVGGSKLAMNVWVAPSSAGDEL